MKDSPTLRSRERERLAKFAPLLDKVIERLARTIESPAAKLNLANLIRWAAHMKMQSELPRGKGSRLLPIMQALFASQYHTYSRGFLTAASHFEDGASGLFGEETLGQWISEAEALRTDRSVSLRYKLFGDDSVTCRFALAERFCRHFGLLPGWYDTSS